MPNILRRTLLESETIQIERRKLLQNVESKDLTKQRMMHKYHQWRHQEWSREHDRIESEASSMKTSSMVKGAWHKYNRSVLNKDIINDKGIDDRTLNDEGAQNMNKKHNHHGQRTFPSSITAGEDKWKNNCNEQGKQETKKQLGNK